MKIIFFGLGSIGQRHARILKNNYKHQIFAYRTYKGEGNNKLGIKELYSWSQIKKIKPDVAFITNPTFLHVETALKCARLGMKLFIEKPIDCSLNNLTMLQKEILERKITAYVAYVLRFHPVIKFLKQHLKNKKIHHVLINNSSYLPYWRPGRDHLKGYSAYREKGGGVILELSHEFDYIEYLFGGINKITGAFAKASNVTHDSEDFMDAVIQTDKCYVNLHQNFLSLNKERTLKIDCANEYILADLVNVRVEIKRKNKNIIKTFDYDVDAMFKKQMDYFFKNIKNNKMMNNLIEASPLFRKILKYRDMKK